MKKRIIAASVLAGAFCGGLAISQAAIPVIDTQNIAETHANVLQSIQTVANTLTQIQNQLLELKTLDSDRLTTQQNITQGQVTQLQTVIKQAQGLLKTGKTAEAAWNETYGDIDTVLRGDTTVNSLSTLPHTMDKTYEDALRTAKTIGQVDEDLTSLQNMMNDNQSAAGNKQALQTQNNLVAQQNTLLMKQNQGISALVTTVAAQNARQNLIDAQTTAQNQKMIEALQNHVRAAEGRRGTL